MSQLVGLAAADEDGGQHKQLAAGSPDALEEALGAVIAAYDASQKPIVAAIFGTALGGAVAARCRRAGEGGQDQCECLHGSLLLTDGSVRRGPRMR